MAGSNKKVFSLKKIIERVKKSRRRFPAPSLPPLCHTHRQRTNFLAGEGVGNALDNGALVNIMLHSFPHSNNSQELHRSGAERELVGSELLQVCSIHLSQDADKDWNGGKVEEERRRMMKP